MEMASLSRLEMEQFNCTQFMGGVGEKEKKPY
jgi:hypothetical protein